MAARRELIQAIAERYRTANRAEKQKIFDEFTEVTGFHRKHAIRALRQRSKQAAKPARSRLYDEASSKRSRSSGKLRIASAASD